MNWMLLRSVCIFEDYWEFPSSIYYTFGLVVCSFFSCSTHYHLKWSSSSSVVDGKISAPFHSSSSTVHILTCDFAMIAYRIHHMWIVCQQLEDCAGRCNAYCICYNWMSPFHFRWLGRCHFSYRKIPELFQLNLIMRRNFSASDNALDIL